MGSWVCGDGHGVYVIWGQGWSWVCGDGHGVYVIWGQGVCGVKVMVGYVVMVMVYM